MCGCVRERKVDFSVYPIYIQMYGTSNLRVESIRPKMKRHNHKNQSTITKETNDDKKAPHKIQEYRNMAAALQQRGAFDRRSIVILHLAHIWFSVIHTVRVCAQEREGGREELAKKYSRIK